MDGDSLPSRDPLCRLHQTDPFSSSDPGPGRRAQAGRAHLAEQPRVVLQQAGPVCVRGDPGILEPVLDGRGGADVFVKEFFAGLLRNRLG